jgi:hypothetical protein
MSQIRKPYREASVYFGVALPKSLMDAINETRGDIPKSKWLQRAAEHHLGIIGAHDTENKKEEAKRRRFANQFRAASSDEDTVTKHASPRQ